MRLEDEEGVGRNFNSIAPSTASTFDRRDGSPEPRRHGPREKTRGLCRRYHDTAGDPNSTTVSTLEKRLSIKDCFSGIGSLCTCFQIAALVLTLGAAIAGVGIAAKNNRDCTVRRGSLEDVGYVFRADASDCHTTTRADTIRGAFDAFLRDVEWSVLCQCKIKASSAQQQASRPAGGSIEQCHAIATTPDAALPSWPSMPPWP